MGIGKTNSASGSGAFGLQIVGGTTRPKNPTQGMVWANTPNEITSVYLADVKPSNPVAGGLWVKIGDSGNKKIVSPVSKEWITVYPLSAEQYINGAWVTIETVSYQDGEWVAWWNGELYWKGNEYTSITGGWVAVAKKYSSSSSSITAKAPEITRYDDYLYATQKGSASGLIHAANKVDLTGYNKLVAEGEFYSVGTYEKNWEFSVWSDLGADYGSNQIATTVIPLKQKTTIMELDISAITGPHIVGFVMNTNGAGSSDVGYNKIVKCYLE